jgi:hypothetical protein
LRHLNTASNVVQVHYGFLCKDKFLCSLLHHCSPKVQRLCPSMAEMVGTPQSPVSAGLKVISSGLPIKVR